MTIHRESGCITGQGQAGAQGFYGGGEDGGVKDGGEENGVKEELTSSHDVNKPLVVGLIFKNKLGRTCGLKRATACRPNIEEQTREATC